jgi:hypothetical protein
LDRVFSGGFVDCRGRLPSKRDEYPHGAVKRRAAPLGNYGFGRSELFHDPATIVLDDNTATSLAVDFSDDILLSGISMDDLFSQIELPN